MSHVGVASSKQKVLTGVLLQTACVLVEGEGGPVKATLLFDSGSDHSYVTSALVRKVRPKWLSTIKLAYSAFGGSKSVARDRSVYEIRARGAVERGAPRVKFAAVEVPVICASLQHPRVSVNSLVKSCDLPLADIYSGGEEASVDILIGMDHYWDLVKDGMKRLPEGPVLLETLFGWVLSGRKAGGGVQLEPLSLLCVGNDLEPALRNFWELESISIFEGEKGLPDRVLETFNETITFVDGRYEVALPWKEPASLPKLLNNERQAEARLQGLSRKLSRDSSLADSYRGALHEMEENGVIEEVPKHEVSVPWPIFYLPHRPVVKESRTSTKVRPVFDASAKGSNGVSLNDCLETGPSLIPSLVEVLVRYRRWPVALTADITKAFLQVQLGREDRDVHRFLWDDGNSVRKMRFRRVTFGINSSPFRLNATIAHHLESLPSTPVIEELKENLYVDDWLSGANSVEEACAMFTEAQAVMQKAGMVLAKWGSNSRVVTYMWSKSLESTSPEAGSRKILGVSWLSQDDAFSFEGVEVPPNLVITKSIVLSCIARLFDPLGFLMPFSMTAKCIFQELWQMGLQWDEEVSEVVNSRFSRWLAGLKLLCEWRIPRCYAQVAWKSHREIELHVFGDASERGYGAVVYTNSLGNL
ncbi:PREDICTED: uncharacterized protein LOC106813672 [Priapulus caudatus]|uniref:Uncharacterized protein LOC106813672 n=1 Tax=Priapulus caudatus TaxID=37621 RepID=A0ABM1EMD5_PRICU|nr:PREDICTED: uncharacterized protein LOC106813672 [Priapulus caudatus]